MNCPLLHIQNITHIEKSNNLVEKLCVYGYMCQEPILRYLFFIIPNHYHSKLNYVSKCHIYKLILNHGHPI